MRQKGFTLIELLVVIAIIGILTALVTVNLAGLQTRGRDSQRKTALENIRTALEKYYADRNTYPMPGSASGQLNINTTNPFTYTLSSPTRTVTYLNQLPTDPRNNSTYQFKYCVSPETSSGSGIRVNYKLFANLENTRDPDRYCKTTGWNATNCEDLTNYTCSPSGTNLTNFNYMVREP